ncbi:MAG: hypothetical protein ACYCTY_11520 [Sulfuricella sp.]
MNKSVAMGATMLASLAILGGCTTMGTGQGDVARNHQPGAPVHFTWKSTDGGQQGTMTATLQDAVYQGRFFQITRQTQREMLTPLWVGWNDGWGDWPYWGGPFAGGAFQGSYDTTQFITHYSGKVLANLVGPNKRRMRCRFLLYSPSAGMAGGGQGECQLLGGRTINATFDPS